MLYNKKIAFLFGFLLFCVASSKGIIIYNEEILVALSFVLFVIFSLSYFGSTIQDSLDERNSTIKYGLAEFHRLKEQSLKQLEDLHVQRKAGSTAFNVLKNDTENGVLFTICSAKKAKRLSSNFVEKAQQKLNHIGFSKSQLQQYLQKSKKFGCTLFVVSKKDAR